MNTSRKVGAARLSYKTTVLVDVHQELSYGSIRTCEKSGDARKHLEVHQWMSVMLCQYCTVMPAWVCGTARSRTRGLLLFSPSFRRYLSTFTWLSSSELSSSSFFSFLPQLCGSYRRNCVFFSGVVRSIRGRFNFPLPFKHFNFLPNPPNQVHGYINFQVKTQNGAALKICTTQFTEYLTYLNKS